MRVVYLAGLISVEYQGSLLWRHLAKTDLEAGGFDVRTPLAGKSNLDEETKDGGITTSIATSKDIMERDYRDVYESDVILAHLELFGSTRPLVGTVAELAWSWQLRKPVVAVAHKDNYLMRNHPFIVECVSHYLETINEAVAFVKRYYV